MVAMAAILHVEHAMKCIADKDNSLNFMTSKLKI